MFLWLSLAFGADCNVTSITELSNTRAPAVIVLGERRSMAPDVPRATKLVRALSTSNQVTIGFDLLDQSLHTNLSELKPLSATPLERQIGWNSGFAFKPYEAMFRLPKVKAIAIGADWEARPEDAIAPIPPGYYNFLAETMGSSPVPPSIENDTAGYVAWRDFRIAQNAVSQWDGNGILVIIADRFHVQGAKGIGWQLARMQEAPVTNVLLTKGNSNCSAGELTLP